MAGVIDTVASVLVNSYTGLVNALPPDYKILPPLAVLTLLIAVYAIFVWIFYRFLARRDLLKIDLSKYNVFEHAGAIKFFAVILYIIEFVIILPFIVIFWFSVLSILLIVLAKEQPVGTILIISAAIVTAVRITSYYKEDLSRDLAKMFPFTLLGIAILTPGFFDIESTLVRVSQIPEIFNNIFLFSLFIIVLEVILRLLYISSGSSNKVEETAQNAS